MSQARPHPPPTRSGANGPHGGRRQAGAPPGSSSAVRRGQPDPKASVTARRGAAGRGAAGRGAQAQGGAPGDRGLGELSFSDWYETPIFEVDEYERIEEMATSGRGPARLFAGMMLAIDARRQAFRERRGVDMAGESEAPGRRPAKSSLPEVGLAGEDRPLVRRWRQWRRRGATLLDRWADKEVAMAARLDRALAPAISWTTATRRSSRTDSEA